MPDGQQHRLEALAKRQRRAGRDRRDRPVLGDHVPVDVDVGLGVGDLRAAFTRWDRVRIEDDQGGDDLGDARARHRLVGVAGGEQSVEPDRADGVAAEARKREGRRLGDDRFGCRDARGLRPGSARRARSRCTRRRSRATRARRARAPNTTMRRRRYTRLRASETERSVIRRSPYRPRGRRAPRRRRPRRSVSRPRAASESSRRDRRPRARAG